MNNNWKLALRKTYSSEKQSFWSRLQLPSISAKLSHLMLAGPCSRSLGEKRLLGTSTAPPTFPLRMVTPCLSIQHCLLNNTYFSPRTAEVPGGFSELSWLGYNKPRRSKHLPKLCRAVYTQTQTQASFSALAHKLYLPTYTQLYPAKSDPTPNLSPPWSLV